MIVSGFMWQSSIAVKQMALLPKFHSISHRQTGLKLTKTSPKTTIIPHLCDWVELI